MFFFKKYGTQKLNKQIALMDFISFLFFTGILCISKTRLHV